MAAMASMRGSTPEAPSNPSPAPTIGSGGGGLSAAACVPLPKVTVPLVDIVDTNDQDVLCGRGGSALRHPGNRTYRQLVNMNKPLYSTCLKAEKLKISRSVVAAIREQNGRFLERASGADPEGEGREGSWYDIGDKKAVEKTSQALREGQPKLRRKMADLEVVTGASSVAAARSLAVASGEVAVAGASGNAGPAISLVTQAMAPGALTSEDGRSASIGSQHTVDASVMSSAISTASTVHHGNLGGHGHGHQHGQMGLGGSFGSSSGVHDPYGGAMGYSGGAAAAHAQSLGHGHDAQRHLNMGIGGMGVLDENRPGTIGRTPSGTPYMQVGGEDAAGGGKIDMMMSENSLRKLKMEHGIPLSEESYRALAMAQQQQGGGEGLMPPPARVNMMDQYAPDPISAQQEAEILAQNQHQQWGTHQQSGMTAAPQSVQEPQHQRQGTLVTSNVAQTADGGGDSLQGDLRGSLQRMGKLPSIRTKLGSNMDFGGLASGSEHSNRSNMGTNISNISLMSDISAIGTSTASGLSGLLGGVSGRGIDGVSARGGMDDMDISARGGLDASLANLGSPGGDDRTAAGGKVAVWDASDSARDMAATMQPKRQLQRASGRGKVLAYMADARANPTSPTTSGAASVDSAGDVDAKREMFAKMRKKARGPPPSTITTGGGAGTGHATRVGGANASGASGMASSTGLSRMSVHSGILSMSSAMGGMSKESFNTRGTGSISTLSWKTGRSAAQAASAAATATTSPENIAGPRTAATAGGRAQPMPIQVPSHRSVDSFGLAVDDMLTGGESGRSVMSNFSRMSLMSDFEGSLGDFSSKDFSSRDCSHASTASRNLAGGGGGGGESSEGASASGQSSTSPRARVDPREGGGKPQGLGTILGSHNEDDDFDGVE